MPPNASSPNRVRTIDSSRLPWGAADADGLDRKRLSDKEFDRCEIELARLPAGSRLTVGDGHGLEVLVLDGQWSVPEGTLAAGGYARRPAGAGDDNQTSTGCTLFVRSGPFAAADTDVVHLPADETKWLPGQGNLRVRPLHAHGGESTALVHWPAGERFVPHRHWGGEEIFVLSGVFEDEHGRYPQGTWILSPHLSTHHPFVREETVIFVKTGHVPPSEPPTATPD